MLAPLTLVLIDDRRRVLARRKVRGRALFVWVAGGLGILFLTAFLTADFARVWQLRTHTRALAATNACLEDRLTRQQHALGAVHETAQLAERAFAQLSFRSGLNLEPGLLEVQDNLITQDAADASQAPDASGPVCRSTEELISDALTQGRTLSFVLGDTLEYFHDASRLLSATPSIRPVQVAWLSSSFGVRRHPIFGTLLMHKGLDLAGQVGLEVVAPADGTVIFTGIRGGYGRVVVLDHGYGIQTHFAHLSRSVVTMQERVKRGDPIAEMGSSGNSTGPHLHYEVRRFGNPLDPRRFILD